MTCQLHTIFTPPRDPPEPTSIYDEIRDLVDQAEHAEETGHPVEAVITLQVAKTRLVTHLYDVAN